MSDVKWKAVSLIRGEPRHGMVAAVQISMLEVKPPRFSFGVGIIVEDGFKPTAFLQDRDIEEYLVLLVRARAAVMKAMLEVAFGVGLTAKSFEIPAETSASRAETKPANPPVLSKGGLRATLADHLKARGGKMEVA